MLFRSQFWFELDFENIIYDAIFNRIMIPCGTDYNGYPNAICVDFLDTASGMSSTRYDDVEFDEDNVRYFNLQGIEVDADAANDEVIIKTDGRRSLKIFNK